LSNIHLFAGCVAIWGTTWLAITFQFGLVAPELSVSYRFLAAALIVAGLCRWRGIPMRFTRAEHAALALMGVAMYSLSYICVYHAEMNVTSGLVAVGYSASPLLSMLGLRIFFGTPMTARMAFGSTLAIFGIVLVFWPEFGRLSHGASVATGALFTALAVLLTMTGGLIAHRNHQRRLHGLPTMAWSMAYGGIASLAVAAALGRPWAFDVGPAYLLSFVYLVLIGTIAAFALWLALLGRVGAARASYVGVMAPVVALFVSTALEGFQWHLLTAAGVAVSVAGNVLVLGRAASQR
jgi:drug/metabolite transporter (DMT)-like permease